MLGPSLKRQRRIKPILLQIAAIVTFVAMIFPIYALFLTSLQPESVIRSRDVSFFPSTLYFAHFAEVLSPGHIVPIVAAIGNSMIVSILTATACVLLALPAAYALARLPVPGGRFILGGLVSIYFLPTILFMIPLFIAFVNRGLNDTFLGLVLLYTGFILPFQIWILRGFIDLVPGDVLVLPMQTTRLAWIEALVDRYDAVTVGFSGWAVDDAFVYRRGLDEGFVLSDHADFNELVEIVQAVDPERVYTTHGATEAFASHLTRAEGYETRALKAGQTTLEDF